MNDRNGDDDLLDRATRALRDDGDSPVPHRLFARTSAAMRDHAGPAARAKRPSPFGHPLLRAAAAVAVFTGGLAAYVALRGTPPPPVAQNGGANGPPVAELRAPQGGTDSAPIRVAADGDVRGRVRFAGVAPRPQVMSMAANAHCAAHHRGQVMDESVVVDDDGTLRNVVVWVSGGLEGRRFAPPAEPAVLDQQGCVYTPHVVTVMTGQRLLVKNSDPFLHNVRAAAANNPPFNFGQPTIDRGTPLVFASPERMFVKCDIHPWMSAFVHVIDNPFFAVTGEGGAFALPDLPPGRYTVSAWHEVYGEQSRQVTVEPGKPLELEFTFRSTQQANGARDAAPADCCDERGTARTFAAGL